MSVLVTLRIEADAERLQAEDPALLLRALDRAREHGLISHRFYATHTELLGIDEWPDEASFKKFFESTPEVAEIMAHAGVTKEPEVTFWRKLDTADAFG